MRIKLLIIGAAMVAMALCSLSSRAVLGSDAPLATLPSPATMTGCVTVRPTAGPNHAPVAVLDACGTSGQRTPTFITGDEWAVDYQVTCTGGSDVFIANAYSATGAKVGTLEAALANTTAAVRSSGTIPVHGTPGAHYIAITTACTWSVKVTSYA